MKKREKGKRSRLCDAASAWRHSQWLHPHKDDEGTYFSLHSFSCPGHTILSLAWRKKKRKKNPAAVNGP
jgi:hypothetical protein